MNTIKKLLLVLFAGILLVGCSKGKYRKTAGGMPYQLFRGKDTQQVRNGDFIKISYTYKVNDSVYFTTEGTPATYRQVSTAQVSPYDISELWTSLKLGDSVVTTQLLDTFMKRDPQNIPPKFKKGDKIITYAKVLAIFKSDTAAQADYEKTNKDWLAGEIKTIEKFLAEKKFTAEKTPSGAFVQMLTPGTGNAIDSGKYVSVRYTGVSWSGKKFDSNTDTSFGIKPPMPFTVGSGNMIKGFDEAVKFMKLGSKAKVYIPSVLAYAGQPNSPLIKPYEILVFDIEIVDVKDKEPTRPELMQQQGVQKIDAPQSNK